VTVADVTTPGALPHESVAFAHNSERQFAKLLDFYGVEWLYEPHTFVLETDASGRPLEAFSPDFYLPAYDLHLEITTQRQKLVTKKNRKARKLVDRYPGTNIKILYQRDYLNLLVKYGLESPDHLPPVEGGSTAHEVGTSLLGLGLFERQIPPDERTSR
jgi:hypothetical protein